MGDAVEHVHVLGRAQSAQLEIREPPQVQPLGEHRVQIAVEGIFDELAVPLAVGHVMGAKPLRRRSVDGRHRQVQPVQQAAEVTVGKAVSRPRRRSRRHRNSRRAATTPDPPRLPAQCPPWPGVGRSSMESSGSSSSRAYPVTRCMGRPSMVVVGGAEQPAVVLADLKAVQFSDPVEPAGVDLQQHSAQPGVVAAAPPAQQQLRAAAGRRRRAGRFGGPGRRPSGSSRSASRSRSAPAYSSATATASSGSSK